LAEANQVCEGGDKEDLERFVGELGK